MARKDSNSESRRGFELNEEYEKSPSLNHSERFDKRDHYSSDRSKNEWSSTNFDDPDIARMEGRPSGNDKE